MTKKPIRRTTRLTSEEAKRDKATREKYKHRPSLESLVASGEYTTMTHGAMLSLLELAAAIKERREHLGMSLADLSKATGIDRSALSRLENGQVENPTYHTLERIAKSLGVRLKFTFEQVG